MEKIDKSKNSLISNKFLIAWLKYKRIKENDVILSKYKKIIYVFDKTTQEYDEATKEYYQFIEPYVLNIIDVTRKIKEKAGDLLNNGNVRTA